MFFNTPLSKSRNFGTVALHSHLDMVCEKNRDVTHDFDREGIKLVRADGYVKAGGTTLGDGAEISGFA